MISTMLVGGLGNQMFQIAALINLAAQNRSSFALDTQGWPPFGGAEMIEGQKMVWGETFQSSPPERYVDTIYRHVPFMDLSDQTFSAPYQEPSYEYQKIPYSDGLVIFGYFQSEKYFKPSARIIHKVFAPPSEIIETFNKRYRQSKEPLVAIHVRRRSHCLNWQHHGCLPLSFYTEAMSRFDKCRFLVFSDEMEWCKVNLSAANVSFVEDTEDYEDLYYMSLCDHNIIANSSFSWWGAWLNDNPDKRVISPTKWYGPLKCDTHSTIDLIPESWETLPNNLEGPHGIVD